MSKDLTRSKKIWRRHPSQTNTTQSKRLIEIKRFPFNPQRRAHFNIFPKADVWAVPKQGCRAQMAGQSGESGDCKVLNISQTRCTFEFKQTQQTDATNTYCFSLFLILINSFYNVGLEPFVQSQFNLSRSTSYNIFSLCICGVTCAFGHPVGCFPPFC